MDTAVVKASNMGAGLAPRHLLAAGALPGRPVSARRRQSDPVRRRRSLAFGLEAETFVSHFLRAGGYTILGRRVLIGRAEVDLIAVRDDTVAFVEVKARKNGTDGLSAVTGSKMRRITRAANAWLAHNPAFCDCTIRFDVALVSPGSVVDYLENAFEAQESDDFVM